MKIGFFILLFIFNSYLVVANEPIQNGNLPIRQQIIEVELSAEEFGKQWNADSIWRSIALYFGASKKWESIIEFEKSADCLREISSFYIILGENKKSLELLQEVRKLDAKYSNFNKTVKTFSLLAISSLRLGKIEDAIRFSDEALKVSQKTNSPESVATAQFTQGLVSYEDGKFKLATELYEKALEIWRNEKNYTEQSNTLLELAYCRMTNDDFLIGLEEAEESFKYANEINNLQYKVLTQNAIGVLKSKLGRKEEALNIFLKSDKEFPEGVNSLEKGDMYNHLAEIYENFDEVKLSQNYRIKALEIYRKENNPFAQLATLSKLGIITFNLGEEEKGLNYFESAFSLATQVKSDFYLAILNQDLGNLYFAKNQEKSLKHLEIALSYFEKIHIKQHFVIIQNNIGSIYQKQGKLELAREHFYSSLKFSRETHNRFIEAESLYRIAKLNYLKGRFNEAIHDIKEAISLTETLTSNVANSKLKSTYFSNVFDRYELYINLLMKMHKNSPNENFALHALQASEKSRARSMLENLLLSEANFTKDANPETVKREKEIRNLLNVKSDELSNLLSSGVGDKTAVEKCESEIRELENELAEINANLKQNSPLYAAIKNPAPFDPAEFQRDVLDENTLLLEFSFGNDASYFWLIGKTEFASYELPPRGQIEPKIIKLRELLASREMKQGEAVEDYQVRIFEAEKLYWLAAHDLSRELFGQIGEKLAGKRLLIVPDGKLGYFPVSALPFPNSGKNEPFILSNEIVYQPSAATLSILSKYQNSGGSKNLLLFSDPIFTSDDPRLKPENTVTKIQAGENPPSLRFVESLESLQRLTASKDEADLPLKIFDAANSDNFSGFAANRENFLNAKIGDYKILHFATHSLLNEERPELSGIVLSGFDEKGNKLNQLVRLQDIYGLNLNCEMVVLSSCNSGIGKETKGEGLQSLNNAFLQVGAKTVISSVWKVDDYATLELMQNFYQTIANENATPAAALRQAQIKMWQSKRYNSPFYWAAFTAQGDFRQKTTITKTSDSRFYWAIPILAILLFGIWRFWRNRQ